MRAETDDYIDESLARFEALLEHTLATGGRGRDKLRQLSDSALQQEFPDPDGQLGMPAAPPPGIGDSLAVPEVDLDEASAEAPVAMQPTLTGAEDEASPGQESAALAR